MPSWPMPRPLYSPPSGTTVGDSDDAAAKSARPATPAAPAAGSAESGFCRASATKSMAATFRSLVDGSAGADLRARPLFWWSLLSIYSVSRSECAAAACARLFLVVSSLSLYSVRRSAGAAATARARACVPSHRSAGIFVRASARRGRARPSWISLFLTSEMLCVAARGGGGRNTASSALCAAANCEIASRRTLDLCGSLSATSPTPGSCRAAAGLSARAITSLDGMISCYPLLGLRTYDKFHIVSSSSRGARA